jgi:hypothetical protein
MPIAIDGDGTITGISVGGLPDSIVDADMLGTKTFVSYAIIAEQQSSGTNGGTLTSGAWRTRSLNTEITDPDGIVSISSNAFTLQAGTYLIEWSAVAFQVRRHRTKLRDTTNSADIGFGMSFFTDESTNASNASSGAARLTITSATTYELQHRSSQTESNGFGTNTGFGDPETYALVKIYKEA